MEGIRFIDIYATKGIEYLIVIAFFAAFVLFCRYMYRPGEVRAAATIAPENVTRFRVPEGLFYHQGHGWLRPEPGSIGVVGLDDFAQKFIGKIDAVDLPPVGSRLAQGDKGWSLVVDGVPIPMLSPVGGEVVEVNPEVLRSPEILREDPYGKGWLLKVKSTRIASNTRNLLSGKLARAWMESALDKLHPLHGESLGPVLQDGGLMVDGIARVLGGDQWVGLAKTHLMTDGE
ncbi:MAG TPA: glycine cleavage system protein H [Patescibacteria group bacterium]|nr:glycine cleavage system protein H [Patescibacteria group bacterium]